MHFPTQFNPPPPPEGRGLNAKANRHVDVYSGDVLAQFAKLENFDMHATFFNPAAYFDVGANPLEHYIMFISNVTKQPMETRDS